MDDEREEREKINIPVQSRNLECHRAKPPYKNTSHSWPRPTTSRVHGAQHSCSRSTPFEESSSPRGRRCVHLAAARSFSPPATNRRSNRTNRVVNARPLITLITVGGVGIFREKLLLSLDREKKGEGGKKGRAPFGTWVKARGRLATNKRHNKYSSSSLCLFARTVDGFGDGKREGFREQLLIFKNMSATMRLLLRSQLSLSLFSVLSKLFPKHSKNRFLPAGHSWLDPRQFVFFNRVRCLNMVVGKMYTKRENGKKFCRRYTLIFVLYVSCRSLIDWNRWSLGIGSAEEEYYRSAC